MSVREPAFCTRFSEAPAKPSERELRRLKPLHEKINGLEAYGNQKGEKFTVRLEVLDNVRVAPIRLEIREVTSGEAYCVTASMHVMTDSVCIPDIWNSISGHTLPPAPEKKGYGFFLIIIETAKKIARETRKMFIEVPPVGPDSADYFRVCYPEFKGTRYLQLAVEE